MRYNCIIVDDEPLAHTVLKSYIDRENILNLHKQFYSAEDAKNYLIRQTPDILFLDVQMPEQTGIELLQSLAKRPVTIFTTAFLDYSLEGFELGVMDYLVKPIHYKRFDQAVKKAINFLELLELKSKNVNNLKDESSLLIKSSNKKYLVNRSIITHVQALRDYAILYTMHDKFVVRSTMKEMEELLGTMDFIRVHRSFIISKIKLQFCLNNKIEFDNFEIPVGRKYKKNIEHLTFIRDI
ncbi:MAG TPA: LytTR family DNA-binding domain-containing protein [Puia sp.]|nr:LytTR family DNA-binding domain-containing protein [Puia sp.]